MSTLLQEYNQLVLDAKNLIALLECNYGFSDEVMVTCRYALTVFIHTCTPEESVEDFKREVEAVTNIIMMELGE